MSKEVPIVALVSFIPYIWMAITFYEGNIVEKCMLVINLFNCVAQIQLRLDVILEGLWQ